MYPVERLCLPTFGAAHCAIVLRPATIPYIGKASRKSNEIRKVRVLSSLHDERLRATRLRRLHDYPAKDTMTVCFGQKLGGWIWERTLSVVGTVRWGSLASVCAVTLAACGAVETRGQRTSLSEGGFLARVPETEKQREFYAALPPNKLYGGVKNGRAFYVFKDEKTGVIYVGNEEDYQHYLVRARRLVAAYETTEAKIAAVGLDNDLQQSWDGSWSREN
jgi:hypothetical protein